MKNLCGVVPATVTSLNRDQSIDGGAYGRIFENMMRHGCSGAMVMGTVGDGRGPIVANTSDIRFDQVVLNTQVAAEAGAAFALNVPPFYNSVTQDIIYSFYMRLADESRLPVLIYNIPENTKNAVAVDTVLKLKRHENIAGIKDSSGNMAYFQQLVYRCKADDFCVFMGKAPLVGQAMVAGASGTMTPLPNMQPAWETEIHRLVKEGRLEDLRTASLRILSLVGLYLDSKYSISHTIKAIMSKQGLCQPYTAGFVPVMEEEASQRLFERCLALGGGPFMVPASFFLCRLLRQEKDEGVVPCSFAKGSAGFPFGDGEGELQPDWQRMPAFDAVDHTFRSLAAQLLDGDVDGGEHGTEVSGQLHVVDPDHRYVCRNI